METSLFDHETVMSRIMHKTFDRHKSSSWVVSLTCDTYIISGVSVGHRPVTWYLTCKLDWAFTSTWYLLVES